MARPRFSNLFESTRLLPSYALLVMVLSVPWALLGLSVHQEYLDTLETARQVMAHQVQFAQTNLSRQLQTTANVLDTVRQARWFQHLDAKHLQEANSDLKNMVSLSTGVRTLLVVNADGIVMASNRAELLGLSMYNSERFRAISQHPHPDLLYLSPPFLTPLKNWAMSVSKMRVKGHHEFDGYVMAILDPSYFQSMMQAILYTDDTRATLVHGDGKVVMRQPDTESLAGQNVAALPGNLLARFQQSGKDRSIEEGVSAATGKSVLAMFATVRPEFTPINQVLVFSVSRELSKIREPWWRHTLERLAMALVLTLWAIFSLHSALRRRRDRLASFPLR